MYMFTYLSIYCQQLTCLLSLQNRQLQQFLRYPAPAAVTSCLVVQRTVEESCSQSPTARAGPRGVFLTRSGRVAVGSCGCCVAWQLRLA